MISPSDFTGAEMETLSLGHWHACAHTLHRVSFIGHQLPLPMLCPPVFKETEQCNNIESMKMSWLSAAVSLRIQKAPEVPTSSQSCHEEYP